MEADARYTYVGAAVLALVAALLVGVVWLKHVGGRGEFMRYAIHFEHQALDGLEVGADVTLRGIKVGRVEDYALSADQLNRVRVVIRVDRRTPVNQYTVAVVTRNFVTGIAAIALVNPDREGRPLTEVPDGEDYPVIGEGRSDLDELAGRVNRLGDMAAATLNSFNQLLSPDNRETMLSTMRSLHDFAEGLNQRLADLDRTLNQVNGAAREVGAAAQRLGGAGDRVAAVAERGGEQFGATLAEAQRTIAQAREAIDRVAAATDGLQAQAASAVQRIESTTAGVDDQVGAAVADLRMSLDAATRVIDKLRDPRAALLGPGKAQLGPGESPP